MFVFQTIICREINLEKKIQPVKLTNIKLQQQNTTTILLNYIENIHELKFE